METLEKLAPGHLSAKTPSGSDEEVISTVDIDLHGERRLLLKVDYHLIPILGFLFMLAFIDRINIGNARIQGLEKDLGMKGNDFNVALFGFFVPYILFEIPSNLILRKVRPSLWISGTMFFWGEINLQW